MKKVINVIKKYKLLISLVIGLIIAIWLISCLIGAISASSASKKNPEATTSFFIKNKDNLYALFNEKGKQLTDFIYSTAGDIYNGVARVKTKNGDFGIINEKGKYVVKLKKYETISQYGSLFKSSKEDNNYLLNKKGKKILSKGEYDTQTFTNVDSFIVVLKGNKYKIINYNGKEIYSFKLGEKVDDSIIPSGDEYKNYGIVSYNGLNVLFNAKTGKVISKIKDDKHYCINGISEDETIFSLNSCVIWYETNDNVDYKVLVNKHIKDVPKECTKVALNNDVLTCTTDDGVFLLDDKLKLTDVNLTNITYKDNSNYAIIKDSTIEFVKNNKVVSKLENAVLADKGYSKDGIYLVYQNGEYSFYNEKGKKLFDKSYKSAGGFDTNSLARVSENGEKFYFINTKGKKISDTFNLSYLSKDYYIITIDSKKGIMDNKGNILVDAKYDDVEIKNNNKDAYVSLKKDNKYILVNLKTKKEVLSLEHDPIYYDHYLKVTSEADTKYYTYTGKLLYEEKA
ncbi:MAG: WG repeat-containing protein [Erysipelotrichales bacterium]|nr:WG repeat-containing protein [Erysipelotrichales bacterium]